MLETTPLNRSGTDIINDLGGSSGSDTDILVVSSGATVNATGIKGFAADSGTKNLGGTANLTAADGSGRTINMSGANTGAFNLMEVTVLILLEVVLVMIHLKVVMMQIPSKVKVEMI